MRFCEAASLAITARLETLFEHEEGTRKGEDAEALHDMRVASRRLRAAMTIFAPCFPRRRFKPLQQETAAITRALGAVRDTDVMLEELRAYRDGLSTPDTTGVDHVIEAVSADRERRRALLIETLDAVARSGYRQHAHVTLWAGRSHQKRGDETLAMAAHRIGVRRIAELYGFVQYVHDPARVEELHAMRKAAKHLRYSLEIFQSCFGPAIASCIERIRHIQDRIGKIHDCDVLIDLLRLHLESLACREHERLLEIALERQTPTRRMERVQEAIAAQTKADPRPGILALLGRKRDERDGRYVDFVRWWDGQDATGLRDTLCACVATAEQPAGAG